jgi:hypothetical protein
MWPTYLFITEEHLILVPCKPRAWHAPPPEVLARSAVERVFVAPRGMWTAIGGEDEYWEAWIVLRDGRRIGQAFYRRQDAEALRGVVSDPPGPGET